MCARSWKLWTQGNKRDEAEAVPTQRSKPPFTVNEIIQQICQKETRRNSNCAHSEPHNSTQNQNKTSKLNWDTAYAQGSCLHGSIKVGRSKSYKSSHKSLTKSTIPLKTTSDNNGMQVRVRAKVAIVGGLLMHRQQKQKCKQVEVHTVPLQPTSANSECRMLLHVTDDYNAPEQHWNATSTIEKVHITSPRPSGAQNFLHTTVHHKYPNVKTMLSAHNSSKRSSKCICQTYKTLQHRTFRGSQHVITILRNKLKSRRAHIACGSATPKEQCLSVLKVSTVLQQWQAHVFEHAI